MAARYCPSNGVDVELWVEENVDSVQPRRINCRCECRVFLIRGAEENTTKEAGTCQRVNLVGLPRSRVESNTSSEFLDFLS